MRVRVSGRLDFVLLVSLALLSACAKGSSGPDDAGVEPRDATPDAPDVDGGDGGTSDDAGMENCIDDDEDGVCNDRDVCPGADDETDSDGDGVPSGCDECEGFDDASDADGDGTPDGCDCDERGSECDENASCSDGIAGVTCACNEGYGGDGYTCTPGGCGPPPPAPDHGSVDAPSTSTGAEAMYLCDDGYELVGEAITTCQEDGSWSGTPPSCEPVDCGPPGSPDNGSVSVASTDLGATATWSCDSGHTLSGALDATCEADGSWSAPTPTCEPVDCGPLPDLPNGTVSFGSTTYGSAATYSCDDGYDLVGDATRTCKADGNWSGAPPSCASTGCGTPPAPVNGSVSVSSTDPGDRASYSCDGGYQLRRGTHSICTDSRSWLGATPECDRVLSCAGCGGPWVEGSRVRATEPEPSSATGIAQGDTGTVLAGKADGLEVLVEWDGWSSGHAGLCSWAECGSCVESGASRWWVDCAEVEPARLRCACSGAFQEGEGVVALVDGPDGADGITAGDTGTVVAGQGSGLELLVEWDGWSGGHAGLCSWTECGRCTETGSSRWWHGCSNVGRSP